jgi:hypothetical protein
MSRPQLADTLLSVSQWAKSSSIPVSIAPSPGEAIRELSERPDLIAVLDLARCSVIELQRVPPGLTERVLLVGERMNEDWLVTVFAGWRTGALIGRRNPISTGELTSAILRLSGKTGPGLESYLAPGSPIGRQTTRDSSERPAVLDAIAAFLQPHELDDRLVTQAVTIAEELIYNAFYHAPVDEAGEHPFSEQSPHEPVHLAAEDAIEVSWGCDERRLGISVVDRFGSLERQTLLRHLAKGVLTPFDANFRMKSAVRFGETWYPVDLVDLGVSEARVVVVDEVAEEVDKGTSCQLVVYETGGEEDFQGGGAVVGLGSTSDGKLELEIDLDNLDFVEGASGGGLAVAYRATSQMVVNVTPGHRTECIGLLDTAGSYRQIVERGRSLHVFHTQERTRP